MMGYELSYISMIIHNGGHAVVNSNDFLTLRTAFAHPTEIQQRGSMNKISTLLLSLALMVFSVSINAVDVETPDNRINLGFNASEKAEFLSEMRQMLTSIQGIMEGIGEEDRELIIKSARYSGNRMARATSDAIKSKTPASFKDIGGPTHMMFEELVIRAETDDMDLLASFTGELMKQCLACHALFKTD